MIKWLLIALIAGAFLSSAAAMKDVESVEDAYPILTQFGGKFYETIVSTVDYAQGLVDIWQIETIDEELQV